MTKAQVSIICNTYNQASYIKDALDSFLNQKTTFRYEILVHDDASTDGTTEIIREYQERYPEIVKPIYQAENQYSKGKKITFNYQIPRAQGRYFAFCEGDDYWIDVSKLQKQFDYMEKNQNCYMCAQGAYRVEAESKRILKKQTFDAEKKDYGMREAIQGYGRMVATSSMFIRREVFEEIPQFAWKAPCGDYIYPILAAKKGYLAYLSDIMSCYRVMAKNSLSETWMKDPVKLKIYYQRYEEMLNEINRYTNKEFVDEIETENTRIWFKYYCCIGDKKIFREKRYINYIRTLSLWSRINSIIRVCCPNLVKKYHAFRRWYGKWFMSLRK